jgi:predicted metal-binding protein
MTGVRNLGPTLLEFKRFLTDYTQVKLVFLEVPIYSLKNLNEHCKHKDPSTFKDQDKQLQVQIITLNKEIRKDIEGYIS